MGGGDVWNALRGQVVHTGKHAEVWENMDKFDRGRREAADAAARGGGDRGSDRGGREGGGPASADGNVGGYRKVRGPDGQMMSGAQMRNARNAEGTVDWKEKFSNDTRFSSAIGSTRSKKDKVVDIDKMAAAAKAYAAAQRAKAEAEGCGGGDGGEDAGGRGDVAAGEKRKRDGGDDGRERATIMTTTNSTILTDASGATEDRPPFALKPDDPALLKRVQKVAEFVVKNGKKFEDVTREKQRDNRVEFSFLWPGGEGVDYYAWLKHCLKNGMNPETPPGVEGGGGFDAAKLAEAARRIAEAAAATESGGGRNAAQAAVTNANVDDDAKRASAAKTKTKTSAVVAAAAAAAPVPVVAKVGAWQAVKDAEGKTYYWNKDTGATTWDPPPGFL